MLVRVAYFKCDPHVNGWLAFSHPAALILLKKGCLMLATVISQPPNHLIDKNIPRYGGSR